MSLMLRRGIEALVGAALVVVSILAVLPAVAEAQSITTTQEAAQGADANPAAARVVVVEPGDSLWSISAEQLGADATLAQIDRKVERIYALNRDQIGPDPNLIFPGQKLSVSAGSGEVAHGSAKATTAPPAAREDTRRAAATSPKKTGHVVSATRGEALQATRPAPRTPEAGLASAKAEKAPAPVGETPSLPKEADAAPAVPVVRQAASDEAPTNGSPLTPFLRDVRSVVASAASELGETLTEMRAMAVEAPRATLGWVILALTVLVGVLMAWRLPMKRTTRSDAQRWGIPTGYYGGGRYTSYSGNLGAPTANRDERGEGPPHESQALEAPVAFGPTTNNGSKANGSRGGVITRAPQVKRRQLSRRAAAARGSGQTVVRKGLVSGLNSAEIHHAALRILPNRRRRRHPKPPNNGGIRAAQRRVSGRV